jgi:hypothetical protein
MKGAVMIEPIAIENIDELRRQEGIDDVELHEEIRRLRVGDHVRLTFMGGANLRETLSVRITRIQTGQFRGRLIGRPVHPDLLGLRADALVTFTAGQIHSIAPSRPASEPKKARQRRSLASRKRLDGNPSAKQANRTASPGACLRGRGDR